MNNLIPDLISCEAFSFSYSRGQPKALTNISLAIRKGDFLLITGETGSGKSTLLRALTGLIPNFSGGLVAGDIAFENKPIALHPERVLRQAIGYLPQDASTQILMQTVEQELGFTPTNLGISRDLITRRVVEASSLLRIDHLLERDPSILSQGEQKRVALAALLTSMPRLLCLDEPFAELSPLAQTDLASTLVMLNRHHGIGIVIAEHNWMSLLSFVDRVIHLQQGQIEFEGTASSYLHFLHENEPETLPTLWHKCLKFSHPRASAILEKTDVRGLQGVLHTHEHGYHNTPAKEQPQTSVQLLANMKADLLLRDISFSYRERESQSLTQVSLCANSGEVIALAGENGAGKTTLLKLISGLVRPQKGQVLFKGEDTAKLTAHARCRTLSLTTINSHRTFVTDTVGEEINLLKCPGDFPHYCSFLLELFDPGIYFGRSPHSLCDGERHIFSILLALLRTPQLLLLDEPTRGVSQRARKLIASAISAFAKSGGLVICATHDLDFAADCASHTTLLHRGKVLDFGPTQRIINGNLCFSSAVSRLHCTPEREPVFNYSQLQPLKESRI